jgi:hypothetical protein
MITLPSSEDPIALVDWLETSLFTQDTWRLSDTAILDVFAEKDTDEDPDILLAAMHRTVRARSMTIGAAYPLQRDGSGYARQGDWKGYLPYSFMLFASLNQSYTELKYAGGSANKPAELFEMLALRAIEKYLQCTVIRIGAPRRHPVPSQFPDALTYAVKELGEVVGQRDLEKHDSGDDGVDLIGWRPFGDARASQAIILTQCSIGTDWRDKRDGVSLKMWKRHIDWHSDPLKGFAVPFHHKEGNPWRETATRAGIIFDRLRIAKLVEEAALPAKVKADMAKWCEARLKKIKELIIEAQ